MLKTKIKRYEFGINVVILVLFAIASGISLLSAYGAACVAWDPTWWGRVLGPKTMFAYMVEFGPLFQVMNVITWVTAFGMAFLIYAYLTGLFSKFIWIIALANSFLAFIAGLIPAIIADTNGFTETFEMGSPHWAKTVVNMIVFLTLLVVFLLDLFKVTSFKSFTAKDNRFSGNVGRQLMLLSFILLWLAAISFLGTTFMTSAHVFGGINVMYTAPTQSLGTVITMTGGVSTLGAGLIYNKIKPPTFMK